MRKLNLLGAEITLSKMNLHTSTRRTRRSRYEGGGCGGGEHPDVGGATYEEGTSRTLFNKNDSHILHGNPHAPSYPPPYPTTNPHSETQNLSALLILVLEPEAFAINELKSQRVSWCCAHEEGDDS